ncbi:MAG: hypothetical protein U1E63_12960 [Burkholderiales bacterium]
MLSPGTASLVVGVTRGLVKLGERADVLLAEKTATQAALTLPVPKVVFPAIDRGTKREALQEYLQSTAGRLPDPLQADRKAMEDLLAQADERPDDLDAAYARFFPERAITLDIDPDGEFLGALRKRFPTLDLMDEDTRKACFYCAAGRDTRELDYPARLALLVADVLAEFAAENTGLFVRDEGARQVVKSVLERFAEPQLETYTAWSPLLRHTLSATLDGVLADRAALADAKPWLDAVLDALALAREKADNGEDFVTGLVRGKGYRTLLASGLLVAGERLAADGAQPYRQIVADVLRAAAPHLAPGTGSQSFATFFQDSWGDLLRAGLASVERYGPTLLEGERPIVREATMALVSELARTPTASLFSGETLFGITSAVIGTVATRPELLDAGIREAWVKDLVGAFAKMANDHGLEQSLTREGLRDAFRTAAAVLGRHPELLSEQPAQRVALIGTVLESVAAAGSLDARTLANGALAAVMTRVGEQPQLLGTRYPSVIAVLAGDVAKLAAAGTLTRVQAADLIDAAAAAVPRNPDLFAKYEGRVATAIVNGVLRGAKGSQLGLLGGTVLVETLGEVLRVVALRGRDLVDTTSEQALVATVADTVAAGLARSEQELGRRLDTSALPLVLAGLVAAVARGEIATVNADDPKFQQIFAALAEAAIAKPIGGQA